MLQKLRGSNNQGFTLIELMIVIAIIGILAAIAIPNFIAYRNKSFCTRAEKDANGIAAAVADYFAIPTHVTTPPLGQLNNGAGYTLSGDGSPTANSGTVVGGDPNILITITVTDGSNRCPDDYQGAMTSASDPKSFWNGSGVYTKTISF